MRGQRPGPVYRLPFQLGAYGRGRHGSVQAVCTREAHARAAALDNFLYSFSPFYLLQDLVLGECVARISRIRITLGAQPSNYEREQVEASFSASLGLDVYFARTEVVDIDSSPHVQVEAVACNLVQKACIAAVTLRSVRGATRRLGRVAPVLGKGPLLAAPCYLFLGAHCHFFRFSLSLSLF